jgi:general secretion pathway protein E
MASPLPGTRPPASRDPAASGDRRLRLDDILKLMVADGLVPRADADKLARARTRSTSTRSSWSPRSTGSSARTPHVPLTLEWLVEWLAGKLGVPYQHIDPLKIDLSAVTATMSNAYAERFRILPVAVPATS